MRKDLTTGSPMRLILGFTLPTLLGMLFQQFYNLVDTMIVGKLLGAQSLAAVGATSSINFLVLGFCMGICNGFAIPVAQRMGARQPEKVRRYVANAAYLSIAIAIVLTVATGLACRSILLLMKTPADIIRLSYSYIFVIFMGIPANFLYNFLAAIIRSLGDSKTPVYFLALSSVLNIGLDFALILYFKTGVAGAAIATVASQGISGLACLFYMRKKFPILRMSPAERKLDLRTCKVLCSMGLPMGLQYSITAIGSIVLQSAINSLGSIFVAAAAAGMKMCQLLACPFDALGSTMATYCGQNVGAGKLDRLGKGLRSGVILALIYALTVLGGVLLFGEEFAMLFLDPKEESLKVLVELAVQFILSAVSFYFLLGLVNLLRFSIQGMGYSALAVVAGMLEMLSRVVMGRFLVPVFGFTAVCFAMPLAWLCADVYLLVVTRICIKRLRKMFSVKAEESPVAVQGKGME